MTAKVTNRTERAVKGTLVSFLQYGTQMLLQLFLAPLVLRLAGQESLGAYALLMQVVGYLAMTDLGFSVTLNRYLAQANGRDDAGRGFRDVLSTARSFLLCSNILFAVLTLFLSLKAGILFSLSPEVALQARQGLTIMAIWAVARTPWTVYGIGLNATQNLVASNFIGIIGNTARLIFSLGLVFTGAGLAGLILANVLAEVLSTFLAARKFYRLYPLQRPIWGFPDKALFREMLRFSGQALLINVAWRLVYYTDNIVVGSLYGAAAVSIYYSTQMPTTIGFNILNRVSDNVAPAINELYARGDDAKVRETFLMLHRLNILFVLPLVGGLVLLNGRLIALWVGSGQYAGELMTAALAAFAFLITVSHVSNTFVFASGKIRNYSMIAVLEGVCNLGLSILLGRYIGLAGVMWGSVITHLPTTLYLLIVCMRSMMIGFPEYLRICLLPLVLPGAAGYAAATFSAELLPHKGWFSFLAQAIILLVVYGTTAYRLSLTKSERSWVAARLFRSAQPAFENA